MRLVFVVFVMLVITVEFSQQSRRRPVNTLKKMSSGLQLPDNATSIRQNIVDSFSCDNRIYGYYADIANECQVFHVCVPQTRKSRRFSFICPAETIFNQPLFVCTPSENSIPCKESEKYYKLNESFGKVDEHKEETSTSSHNNGNTNAATFPTRKPTKPTSQRPPIGSTPHAPRPTTKPATYPTSAPDHHSTQNSHRPAKPTTNYPNFTPDQQSTQYTQKPPVNFPSSTTNYQPTQQSPKSIKPTSYQNYIPEYPSTQHLQKPVGPNNYPNYAHDYQTTQYTQRPPQSMQNTGYWIQYFK